MTSEEFTEILVKSIVGNVPERIYEDGFSGVTIQLGKALGTLGEAVNAAMLPFRFGVDEVKLIEKKQELRRYNSLLKYANTLKFIPPEKIVEVPSEILIPIINRFSYTSNEELSNAFINLLTKASSIDTVNMAHPGFISIIDRLSPDEAVFLTYFREKKYLMLLDLEYEVILTSDIIGLDKTEVKSAIKKYKLKEKIQLKYFDNFSMYVENLISLGILRYTDKGSREDLNNKSELTELIKSKYDFSNRNRNIHFKENCNYLTLTLYGELFINTCLKE